MKDNHLSLSLNIILISKFQCKEHDLTSLSLQENELPGHGALESIQRTQEVP